MKGTLGILNTLHFGLHVRLGKTESQSMGWEMSPLLDSVPYACENPEEKQKWKGSENTSDLNFMLVNVLFPTNLSGKKHNSPQAS